MKPVRDGIIAAALTWVVLTLIACELDLVSQGDPTYEAECVFHIGVGERVDIYRDTFEKCNPVSIVVVSFGS